MALPDNPTPKQMLDFCDDALLDRWESSSGFDLVEWRKMANALYKKEDTAAERFGYLLGVHSGDILFIAALLESTGDLFHSNFDDLIPEIPVRSDQYILEVVARRLK